MMTFNRLPIDDLLHDNGKPPQNLDYLEFEYQGVTFRCFGILHGITGGLNQDYCHFIKNSIKQIKGLKLAEKGMKQLYRGCGIDEEMEDWLVLRKIDCLIMGFQLIADPRCLWMISVDAIREKLRKHDPFIVNGRQNISDLGESPYFHYMDEYQRRDLMGFLPSKQAIANDLDSMTSWYRAILPRSRHVKINHPQWHRILLLERLMHIPCRSIHMLHYALAYAKQHDHKLVNIFVGETHNTDMHYLAGHLTAMSNSMSDDQNKAMQKIINRAEKFGRRNKFSDKLELVFKKSTYILFLLIGASISFSLYFLLFNWISG